MRSISNGRALIYTRIANDDALWAHRLPGNRVSATYLQNLGVFRLGWARPSPPSPLSLTRERGSSLSTQTKHTHLIIVERSLRPRSHGSIRALRRRGTGETPALPARPRSASRCHATAVAGVTRAFHYFEAHPRHGPGFVRSPRAPQGFCAPPTIHRPCPLSHG